jgi:hypothetical protein
MLEVGQRDIRADNNGPVNVGPGTDDQGRTIDFLSFHLSVHEPNVTAGEQWLRIE